MNLRTICLLVQNTRYKSKIKGEKDEKVFEVVDGCVIDYCYGIFVQTN